MSPTDAQGVTALPDLVSVLRRQSGFPEVLAALQRGSSATVDGAWGSACALTSALLGREVPGTLVVVLPRLSEMDDFAGDLAGFLGENVALFPAWETLPREATAKDNVFSTRLRIVQALRSARPPRVIVTCGPALLQPVPAPAAIEQATRIVQVGETIPPEDLLRWLVERGCERVTAIELPGEVALHGGILDVFPPAASEPLRIEFFGDDIESIRQFDPQTQRKLADLQEAVLTFLSPPTLNIKGQTAAIEYGWETAAFADLLPPASWIGLVELSELQAEMRHYWERLDHPLGMFPVEEVFRHCTTHPTITLAGLSTGSFETTCHLRIESVERFSGAGTAAVQQLLSIVGPHERLLLTCHNAGEQERIGELLAETDLFTSGRVSLCVGYLQRGFRLVSENLIVLSDHELFNRQEIRRALKKRAVESRAIDSFLELTEGDLVVHLAHGIARYHGMKLLTKSGQVEEHLVLEFRDRVQMYVPVSLIHLVQKYVGGGGKSATPLSKIGGTSWEKKKQAVAEALQDLASEMLQLQAQRELQTGLTFPVDSHWQTEFEAAFPYTETDDQLRAIADIKQDMERARPMDRLICGDVGYGKTEVALRAAFKALDNGHQVAVLVPTTVLAEQHFRSFTERMAEFPFTIEVLSRFRSKGEIREVLEGLESGRVDLVVGTHRLVQKDVRFKNLGLLVIDEEQRFGVDVKERLKRLRLQVEVLTLSATPIPRTLHLSLLGIRDISNLTTPPQDRLAIETRIVRFDDALIRQAIIRELNRSGQVYFVHNRVFDIQSIADRLQRIVPEARIGIIHGQMHEDELEPTLSAFVRGQLDILVATTIIESGLDIPRANTMFVHQAEHYGLADLHQLRGRVGRYKHRAYCYLLLEEGKSLSDTAAKRLKAIEEFSELGAGFKIAMRDLEIRGAGNILGNEQSGHIVSIGYELYCQLLENAVRRLKNQPPREVRHVNVDLPITAFFPGSYIPPGRHKIEVYRRMSQIASSAELTAFREELRDRFGPLPTEAEWLCEIKELQLLAWGWRIDELHLEGKFAVFGYRNSRRLRDLLLIHGTRLRVVDTRNAYYLLNDAQAEATTILAELKSVLQPATEATYNSTVHTVASVEPS